MTFTLFSGIFSYVEVEYYSGFLIYKLSLSTLYISGTAECVLHLRNVYYCSKFICELNLIQATIN